MRLSEKDIDLIAGSLVKMAWVAPVLGAVAKAGWWGAKQPFKFVGSAFKGTKNQGFGGKAKTWLSRGALGTGAYMGVDAALKSKRVDPNYTSFLRNNALAGKISPEEMDQADLQSVKNIGMKKISFLGTAVMAGMYGFDALGKAKGTVAKAKLPPSTPPKPVTIEGGMLS